MIESEANCIEEIIERPRSGEMIKPGKRGRKIEKYEQGLVKQEG